MGDPQLWPLLGPKPLNRPIYNFARLITSSNSRDAPKIITLCCTVAPPHTHEIWRYCGLFCFFCVLSFCAQPERRAPQWSKCAHNTCFPCRKSFSGARWWPQSGRVRNPQKPPNFASQRGISSIRKTLNNLSYVRDSNKLLWTTNRKSE